jgi:transcriptional regulator with XRE-family HTH domain
MKDLSVRIGENIRQLRTKKGLSQDNLASILGVDKSYISRIENGQKNLTLNSLMKIANALVVDIKKLLK